MGFVIVIVAVVTLTTYVGVIWATVSVARSKGRDPAVWGLLAFFFGIIPLIVVALVPPFDDASSGVSRRVAPGRLGTGHRYWLWGAAWAVDILWFIIGALASSIFLIAGAIIYGLLLIAFLAAELRPDGDDENPLHHGPGS